MTSVRLELKSSGNFEMWLPNGPLAERHFLLPHSVIFGEDTGVDVFPTT